MYFGSDSDGTPEDIFKDDLQSAHTSTPHPPKFSRFQSVETSLSRLIQTVVQDPLPEDKILVAVELIKTAGSDQELSVLFETLGGLGPFKFPFEVIVMRTCEVLKICLSPASVQSM
jgi:hypothetical protein